MSVVPRFFAFFICLSASSPALAQSEDHFEKKVRPVILAKCISCHGPEKSKGGLRLDAAGIAKGGQSGPVLVAGKPDESLLLEVVRQTGFIKMPPKGKLKDEEIADLAAWVKAGAVWPNASTIAPIPVLEESRVSFSAEQKAFWAFQPVKPTT
jgi:cytochrome c553